MKKILSLVLALILAFALTACQKASDETTPSESDISESTAPSTIDEATTTPSEEETPSASGTSDRIGFFDASYDYSQNPTYKVVYMINASSMLTQVFSDAFSIWAEKMNIEYSDWAANSDNDLFITTFETFITQGYDGYLLDPDTTIYSRLVDVADANNVDWMSVMGAAQDDDGKLMHPYVGADNYQYGIDMANWLISYQKDTWPEAESSEIGMLSIDFSVNPLIHERTTGAQSVWDTEYPDVAESNFFVADGITTGRLDADTGFNISSPIISSNPQIKYWLIAAAFDDYAQGAALAAESAGKTDTTIISSIGGTILISLWDAGEDSCWKSSLYTPQIIFSEAIIGGLYALMSGQATPETLWPDWINHSADEQYANILIQPFLVTKEEYQEEMEFVDAYTGTNTSDYPYNGTTYPILGNPPAYYNG